MQLHLSAGDSPGVKERSSKNDLLKILVVDDDPEVLANLCDGLAILGFDACGANSAYDGLTLLHDEPRIAVVITDIRIPGADGLQFAHEILTSRTLNNPVQVILMTGHASIEDATAALRSGVSDLLRKPFRLAEVGDAITKALATAQERRRLSF